MEREREEDRKGGREEQRKGGWEREGEMERKRREGWREEGMERQRVRRLFFVVNLVSGKNSLHKLFS